MHDPIDKVKKELAKFIGEPGNKRLNPGTLVKNLMNKTSLGVIEVQQALLHLSKEGFITGINVRGIPVKKVGWTDIKYHPISESRKLVDEIVKDVTIDKQIQETLLKHHKYFNKLNKQDIVSFMKGLLAFKDSIQKSNGDRYVLSARHLLGSSKALSNISRLIKDLKITLPEDNAIYYVLTAGRNSASQILFIENPRVFTFLQPYANEHDTLIISSYGYGLTLENFGDKLARGQVIACPTDGERQCDLARVLKGSATLYWGDLDKTGIQIYDSLSKHLPALSLSAIYENMVNDVESSGHPYHPLFEKANQKSFSSRLRYSNELLSLCQDRAIDQEFYCNEQYLHKIFKSLSSQVN